MKIAEYTLVKKMRTYPVTNRICYVEEEPTTLFKKLLRSLRNIFFGEFILCGFITDCIFDVPESVTKIKMKVYNSPNSNTSRKVEVGTHFSNEIWLDSKKNKIITKYAWHLARKFHRLTKGSIYLEVDYED